MPGFIWFGSQFTRQVVKPNISARLHQAGAAGADEARRVVHVDTGQTQRSISYTVDESRLLLQLHADTAWAYWLEFRYPYLRPGLAVAAKVFGGGQLNLEAQFLGTPESARARHGQHVAISQPRGLRRLWQKQRTARLNLGR